MTDCVYKSAAARAAVEARYAEVLDHWPVPVERRMVTTRLGETFVLVCGPADGAPVVLLHGSQANSAAWRPDVERWASRFRLYAIDMIGEAGFSAPVRPPLEGEDHAVWLDEAFAELGLRTAAVVGTSLGGWLALDHASRRPGFARALVLLCPAGIGRQRNFLARALPLLLLGSWGKRRVRELVFGPEPHELPASLVPIAGLMEEIGRGFRPRVLKIPQLSDAGLASLAMPLLTIVGGRDALIDSRDTRARLLAARPDADVRFIEEGYHFLPDQTETVMRFLQERLAGA